MVLPRNLSGKLTETKEARLAGHKTQNVSCQSIAFSVNSFTHRQVPPMISFSSRLTD